MADLLKSFKINIQTKKLKAKIDELNTLYALAKGIMEKLESDPAITPETLKQARTEFKQISEQREKVLELAKKYLKEEE